MKIFLAISLLPLFSLAQMHNLIPAYPDKLSVDAAIVLKGDAKKGSYDTSKKEPSVVDDFYKSLEINQKRPSYIIAVSDNCYLNFLATAERKRTPQLTLEPGIQFDADFQFATDSKIDKEPAIYLKHYKATRGKVPVGNAVLKCTGFTNVANIEKEVNAGFAKIKLNGNVNLDSRVGKFKSKYKNQPHDDDTVTTPKSGNHDHEIKRTKAAQ